MKKATRDVWISFDGIEWMSEEVCRQHERSNEGLVAQAAAATVDEIVAAINGQNDDLAEVFERLGARIAKERRDRGRFKRPTRERAPTESNPPTPDEWGNHEHHKVGGGKAD